MAPSSCTAMRVPGSLPVVAHCGIIEKTNEEWWQAVTTRCKELVATSKKVGIHARANLMGGYIPGYEFKDWDWE